MANRVQNFVQSLVALLVNQSVQVVHVVAGVTSVLVAVVVAGVGKTVNGVVGVRVRVSRNVVQFIDAVKAGGVYLIVNVQGVDRRVPVVDAEVVGVNEVVLVVGEDVDVDGVVVRGVVVNEKVSQVGDTEGGAECFVPRVPVAS